MTITKISIGDTPPQKYCKRLFYHVIFKRQGAPAFSYFFYFIYFFYFFYFVNIVDRFGSLWIVFGSLLVVVDRFGFFVGRCGSFWVVVDGSAF